MPFLRPPAGHTLHSVVLSAAIAHAGCHSKNSTAVPEQLDGSAVQPVAASAPSSTASVAAAGLATESRTRSHDGRWQAVASSDGVHRSKLRIEEADGSHPRLLIDFDHFHVEPGERLDPARSMRDYGGHVVFEGDAAETALLFAGNVNGMAFSPDDHRLYVLTNGWATSNALYAVDVESAKVRFVIDSNLLYVIDRCRDPKYVGRLVVGPLHTRVGPVNLNDWRFLADDTGNVLGAVGPGDENVARFLADRCGIGTAPPARAAPPIPPVFRRKKLVRCEGKGILMRYYPMDLLDGTTEHLFHFSERDGQGGMDESFADAKELCPEVFRD